VGGYYRRGTRRQGGCVGRGGQGGRRVASYYVGRQRGAMGAIVGVAMGVAVMDVGSGAGGSGRAHWIAAFPREGCVYRERSIRVGGSGNFC
jgi:hypothetical protein